MVKRHKILAMIVSCIMAVSLFALAGCGNKGAEPAKESKQPEAAQKKGDAKPAEESADVIVVGAGGAGMTAAITAHDKGASVIIVEKAGVAGGNTNFSSSGMNASETKFQKEQGIKDSNQLFIDETMKGGHEKNDKELVTFMCDHSAAAIDWLDSIGLRLDNITITGGFSVKRCHRPTDGSAIGGKLVETLLSNVEKDGIKIEYETKATDLIKDGDKIVGVKAVVTKGGQNTEKIFKGKAIILATGGFAANQDMVAKYKPEYKGMVTTNPPTSTGDGLIMAEKVGAELVQMENIQIHPTVEQKTSALIAEGMRGAGAILVNQKGERFTNEMSTRDAVSAAELKQEGGYAWEIMDEKIRKENKALDKYIKKKIVVQANDLASLAKEIGVDPATLEKTVAEYNKVAEAGSGDPFERTTGLAPLKEGPFYAIKVAPGIHHTMGGIRVDTKSEALTKDGKAIPGLYAAGEVTGGLHGANRIGGNAICDIIVFGRNAGEQAADYAKSH